MKLKLIILSAVIALNTVILSGCSAKEDAPAEGGTTTSTSKTSDEPQNEETTTTESLSTLPPETAPTQTEQEGNTPEWTETAVSGQRYVNTDNIYSRIKAIQGSQTVKQYRLNDMVTVVARTDTDYYKLDDGSFIHADYLSETETEVVVENVGADYASVTSKGYVIERKNGITYVDGIMIANKTFPLPSSYDPGVRQEASDALAKMQKAAAADGINLFVISGYRSYSYQESVYASWVSIDGKAQADRYSARPGFSEHQSGYAFDLNSCESSFADTPEAKWLEAYCAEYGFIIRYPKGKESVTGYIWEPWHVRYIGVEKAKAVTASGLTLEEYYGFPSSYDITGDVFV